MHSDDFGKTWNFDRWVLTSEEVCFTSSFNPDNIKVLGQKEGIIKLGSGDLTLFDDPNSEYLYLFYNIIKYDMKKEMWISCDTYLARSRRRDDGVFTDFTKYYNGSFSEAGNFGKESIIVPNSWHSRVVYSLKLKCYIMSYTKNYTNKTIPEGPLSDTVEFRTSTDLIHWSEPCEIEKNGKLIGNHYNALVSLSDKENPYVIDDECYLLSCHNGTDVKKMKISIK